jgi:Pentapeptide repeats (8 copies)
MMSRMGFESAQMNESSLTKVPRGRLLTQANLTQANLTQANLTQANPWIPTNVNPKTATPDHDPGRKFAGKH